MKTSVFSFSDFGVLGGLGLLLYGAVKVATICKKIDVSVSDLASKTNVDIEQSMVDKAVETAVTNEVRKAVTGTAARVGEQVRADLQKSISTEVKAQYNDISDKVTKQVAEEVGKIDEPKLREKVAVKAEKIVLDKLEGSTNEALAKLNKQLGITLKTYEGIGETINTFLGGKRNGGGFRISMD
jgi:hypothetical protein